MRNIRLAVAVLVMAILGGGAALAISWPRSQAEQRATLPDLVPPPMPPSVSDALGCQQRCDPRSPGPP